MGFTGARRFYEFTVSHKRVWRLATEAEAEEYRRTGRLPSLDPPRQATLTRQDMDRDYDGDMDEANEW
jgi:hypothetical protein